jgi:pterin-4a-carbinolamine dehydratase
MRAFAEWACTPAYASHRIAYCTHCVGGVSENDLICAAKIEAHCATGC